MKLIIHRKRAYGRINLYVQGPLAAAIATLTDNKTVNEDQVEALRALGFEVQVIDIF